MFRTQFAENSGETRLTQSYYVGSILGVGPEKQVPITCPSHRIPEVLRMVRREYAGRPMDTRDGVKVLLDDGWFHMRASNTEPVVRVVAEASSDDLANRIVSEAFERIAVVVRGA